MEVVRQSLRASIKRQKKEIQQIRDTHLNDIVDEVSVKKIFGGMRGIVGMVCNTSYVDPEKGLIIRGHPIKELTDRLPEEIFYLLISGELPNNEIVDQLQEALKLCSIVPSYVWDVLDAMPGDSHPMAMLGGSLLAMERESIFKRKYEAGMRKVDYWEATFDEALMVLGRLPTIAAAIYRTRFERGPRIHPNPQYDWSTNFAHMLGENKGSADFRDFIRLYMVIHCDHEGGNVSAFSSRVVGSALSDLYYALTTGFCGLAGPLHGLANQDALKFVLQILDHFEGPPSEDQLSEYIWATLHTGRVIPGYGHAVLRATDPRFEMLYDFGMDRCPGDDICKVVRMMYQMVPGILQEHGKASNPYPNVDAASGALLFHYGITFFDFYTVMFAVSRAIGICAQAVLARALGLPLVRPKTVTNEKLLSILRSRQEKKSAQEKPKKS